MRLFPLPARWSVSRFWISYKIKLCGRCPRGGGCDIIASAKQCLGRASHSSLLRKLIDAQKTAQKHDIMREEGVPGGRGNGGNTC